MQGLHHQQQQLAALLSVALPKDDSGSASKSTKSDDDDSARLAAVNSLHRAILYPPNSLLVTHSATFLAQGFSQLLSDKSYGVRQEAAVAYGALCAVVCSLPITSNGRQNHVMLGSLVDRFIGWALPLLSNISAGDGTMELALDSLREFLNVGDVGGIDRYALSILKACQVLLEDERTSLTLLHRLLSVLTLISLKFSRYFQPHFLDIVDLLLGWALVPDLAESDRRIIMDSFLQFQSHWVGNLQFSLGLLSKFVGDMDVLIQDVSHGTPQQFRRLLALLSCFSTVLQSTASGLLEMNLLEQITEPLNRIIPRLLGCLSMVGRKFGWSEWIGDSWKCLTLLAEIFCERFSTFYAHAVDILFQSLEADNSSQPMGTGRITSFQVHGVLKTNLQLLSLQKFGLLPFSVQKILQFDAPISQLRLHPNHLVTGSSAATYIFLLQHGNNEVVEQAVTSLAEELELLKGMLQKAMVHEDGVLACSKTYSKRELFALIKFDLKVLLSCVFLSGGNSLIGQPDIATLYLMRSDKLVSFIIEKFNPFDIPIREYVELQVNVMKTFDKLTAVKFLSTCSLSYQSSGKSSMDITSDKLLSSESLTNEHSAVVVEHLRKYGLFFVKALHVSSPLAVKVIALDWVQRFCENVIALNENSDAETHFYEVYGYVSIIGNMFYSILDAASDREPKVRSHVAIVLELLLQARLVHPLYFYCMSEVVLGKLGDPDIDIKNAFVRLLAIVGNSSNLQWKQVFSLKQLPQQLHSQQLVTIMSYLSQRWKVPLSSWIQRLIHSCRSSKDLVARQLEETGNVANGVWLDIKVDDGFLEKHCSVNNLAGAWWAVQETARYCISTRLRTNLGGPTQTFAALERMLLDVAHLLQYDSEQTDGNLSMIGSSGAHLLPMRLLFDFVEALKKNVYNAYEGSAVLPSATRSSSLFFRANKKVCEEWFSRICEPMMNAGLALQCHDATIHYCALRLQELWNLVASALNDKSRVQVTEHLHNIKEETSPSVTVGCLDPLPGLLGLYIRHKNPGYWSCKHFVPSMPGKSYCGALTTTGNEINAIHALATLRSCLYFIYAPPWDKLWISYASCCVVVFEDEESVPLWHAAHGFIQYLSYSSAKICNSGLADSDPEPLKQKTGSYTLRATLYVLHILLNYGAELKDILEPALSTVPLSPWQEVTPQLFARLSSHPEQVVRKQLEGLLMMLAKQSPWSIVYPTLVDVNAYEEKPSEELQHLLGCLSELYPRLIQDVQLVINDLGNVTVLWEELWLSTLQIFIQM
ncbi:hypothetical protein M0R45_001822 [Rubus argutus]|uniref:Non-specific serine/threonine protein kinase n=1 Tax=Rubus argutus TaxID=59490 RepID=A0AAW1VFV6_RUBAR